MNYKPDSLLCNMIKVSVIVAAYNVEKYIGKCLDTLVNQSLQDMEIIVVNDASKDGTLNIIKEYQDNYPNVVLVNHEVNKGIGRTRNDGIEAARGEYLGFVDGDDYVDTKMFEAYYTYAKANDLDMVYAGYSEDRNGSINRIVINQFENCSIHENPAVMTKMEYGPVDKIYRRSIIVNHNIRFPENLKYEDMPFPIMALKYSKVGSMEGNYYYYVIHENSESTTIDKRCFDLLKILDIINEGYAGSCHDEIEYINIVHITRHVLKQRFQKDREVKNRFIDMCYEYLNTNYPNWRKNKYYLEQPFIKRVIKNNKLFVKLYSLLP